MYCAALLITSFGGLQFVCTVLYDDEEKSGTLFCKKKVATYIGPVHARELRLLNVDIEQY